MKTVIRKDIFFISLVFLYFWWPKRNEFLNVSFMYDKELADFHTSLEKLCISL